MQAGRLCSWAICPWPVPQVRPVTSAPGRPNAHARCPYELP